MQFNVKHLPAVLNTDMVAIHTAHPFNIELIISKQRFGNYIGLEG